MTSKKIVENSMGNGGKPDAIQQDSVEEKIHLAAILLKITMDNMVKIIMIHRKVMGRRNPLFNSSCAALDQIGRGIVAALVKYASDGDGEVVETAIKIYIEYVAEIALRMPPRHLHAHRWITTADRVACAARKIQHELDLAFLANAGPSVKNQTLRSSYAKLIEESWQVGFEPGMDNYDPPQDVVLANKKMSGEFAKSLKRGVSASQSAMKVHKDFEGAIQGMSCCGM